MHVVSHSQPSSMAIDEIVTFPVAICAPPWPVSENSTQIVVTQALTAVGAWRRLAKADGDEVPMEWVELRWLWLTSRYNQRTATSGFRTDGQADRQDRAELHRRQANRSTRYRQGNP